MRKFLLLLILLPLLFVSCSSDDDDDKTTSGIVGTWVTESVSPKTVDTNDEALTTAINENIASFGNETFVFTNDGKVTMDDGDDIITVNYSLKGNMLTLSFMGESNTVPIYLSANKFTADIDETEEYQEMIDFLIPGATAQGLKISKVITSYSFKRK